MARNEKAEAGNFGSKEKWLKSNQLRFFNSDYNTGLENIASIIGRLIRCKFCGSDYMRFAINGYCQRCQQRAEYVLRENPATAERARWAR